MENPTLLVLLTSFLCVLLIFIIFTKRSSDKSLKLPPGPRPYPIIGNILELGSNPLSSLIHLSKTHGPIMSLKLGTTTAIHISSPEIAREVFQTNDQAFSDRTFPDSARALNHHKFSMAWLPVSPQWRVLRRSCATKIFSSHQLDSTQIRRHRKVRDLLDYVHECCRKGEAVDLCEAAFTAVLNSMSNMFFSVDFCGHGSGKSQEYKELVKGIVHEVGRFNVVDVFPVLSFLDPQRARARLKAYYTKLYTFFDGIMEERLRSRGSKMESRESIDVLDSFLDLLQEENSQLNRPYVLHLFIDLFAAATDTTASTLEWAMAELIRNPEKMIKAKDELQHFLGKNGKLEESLV